MIPPSSNTVCACANLKRATRAICHLYDLVLSPTQLKVTQFTMLRSIAEAGEIAHCDLARRALGSEETFSRRLAAARRSGWVLMRLGNRQRRILPAQRKRGASAAQRDAVLGTCPGQDEAGTGRQGMADDSRLGRSIGGSGGARRNGAEAELAAPR